MEGRRCLIIWIQDREMIKWWGRGEGGGGFIKRETDLGGFEDMDTRGRLMERWRELVKSKKGAGDVIRVVTDIRKMVLSWLLVISYTSLHMYKSQERSKEDRGLGSCKDECVYRLSRKSNLSNTSLALEVSITMSYPKFIIVIILFCDHWEVNHRIKAGTCFSGPQR